MISPDDDGGRQFAGGHHLVEHQPGAVPVTDHRHSIIGMVAAGEVLDFFLQALAEDVYNKAISDTKGVVKKNFENLDVDLDLLFSKK